MSREQPEQVFDEQLPDEAVTRRAGCLVCVALRTIWGMNVRRASCSCGQLQVEVEGEPLRVSVCHCLACQRRTGSAFGVQARWENERATVAGESREYVRISDEGEARTFSFCPECAATVFYRLESRPDLIAVPVGAFADPAFPAPWVSVWESRRHPWVGLPAELHREG